LRAPYHDGLTDRHADAGKTCAERIRHLAVQDRRRGAAFEDAPGPMTTGGGSRGQRPTARPSTGST
jgi:hypothetical protein